MNPTYKITNSFSSYLNSSGKDTMGNIKKHSKLRFSKVDYHHCHRSRTQNRTFHQDQAEHHHHHHCPPPTTPTLIKSVQLVNIFARFSTSFIKWDAIFVCPWHTKLFIYFSLFILIQAQGEKERKGEKRDVNGRRRTILWMTVLSYHVTFVTDQTSWSIICWVSWWIQETRTKGWNQGKDWFKIITRSGHQQSSAIVLGQFSNPYWDMIKRLGPWNDYFFFLSQMPQSHNESEYSYLFVGNIICNNHS